MSRSIRPVLSTLSCPPVCPPTDAPASPLSPEQLGHLVEMLELSRRSVDVPSLVVLAGPAAADGSDEPALDLAITPVVGDPRTWLAGFVVDAGWSAVGLVATGSTVSTSGSEPEAPGEPVSVAYACGRDRTCAVSVRIGDRAPVVQVTGPGRQMPSGRVVDLLWRALGLPTSPPVGRPEDLAADVWLHRVLVDATDVGPGRLGPGRADIDRLEPRLPGSWERLRRERADGSWPELGIDPHLAEWMDAGSFARACGEAFAERHEVLSALADVLDPAVWHHLIGRIGPFVGPH